MAEWLAYPWVRGALSGIVSAATVDILAFRQWKSFNEAASYGWMLAVWRWFQGAVTGSLTSLGLSGLGV